MSAFGDGRSLGRVMEVRLQQKLIERFIESFNEAFNEAFNGLPSSPCAPPSHGICICLSYVCHIPIQLNGIHKRRGVPPPVMEAAEGRLH